MKKENFNENELFIKLDYQLIQRTDITLHQKLIIAYLKSFQVNNKVCYQTQEEIAETLSFSISTVKKNIKNLKERNIIKIGMFSEFGIKKNQFKNRKATVYIENDCLNQNIINEESIIKDLSNDNSIIDNYSTPAEVVPTNTSYNSSTEDILKDIIATAHTHNVIEETQTEIPTENKTVDSIILNPKGNDEDFDIDFDNLSSNYFKPNRLMDEEEKETNNIINDDLKILNLQLTVGNIPTIKKKLKEFNLINSMDIGLKELIEAIQKGKELLSYKEVA